MRVNNTTNSSIAVAPARRFPITGRIGRTTTTMANRLNSQAQAWDLSQPLDAVTPLIDNVVNRSSRIANSIYDNARTVTKVQREFANSYLNGSQDAVRTMGDWFHIAGIYGFRVLDELDIPAPDLVSDDPCLRRYLNPFDVAVGQFRFRTIVRENCREDFDNEDDDEPDLDPRNPPRREDLNIPAPYTERTCVAYSDYSTRTSKSYTRKRPGEGQPPELDQLEHSDTWQLDITDKYLMWVGAGSYWDVWINVRSGGEPWEDGYDGGWSVTWRLMVKSPWGDHFYIAKSLPGAKATEGVGVSYGGGYGAIRRAYKGTKSNNPIIHECSKPPDREMDDKPPTRYPPPSPDDEDEDMDCCRTVRQNNELLRRIYREMCTCEEIEEMVCSCEDIEKIVNPRINYATRDASFQALPVGVDSSERLTRVVGGQIDINGNYQEALLQEVVSTRDSLMDNLWSMYQYLFDIENDEMELVVETWKDKFFGGEERPAIPEDSTIDGGDYTGGGSFGGGESGGGGAGSDTGEGEEDGEDGEGEEEDESKIQKVCWVEIIPHAQSRLHIIDETNWTNLRLNAEMLCAGVEAEEGDGCNNLIPLMPDERFAQIPVPSQLVLTFGAEYPTQNGSLWHMSIPVPNSNIIASAEPWYSYFDMIKFNRGGEVLVRIYWEGSKMWTGCYVEDESEADKLVEFVSQLGALEMTNIRISKGGRRVAPDVLEVRCVRAAYVVMNPDRTVNELYCFVPPKP